MSISEFGDWSTNDPGFVPSILATVIFKCLIQGVLFAAGYRYFSIVHNTKDGTKMRTFVAIIIVLNSLHAGVSIAKLYLVVVKGVFWGAHWLNACDTTLASFLCPTTPHVDPESQTGFICFMAQLFFAYRCRRITKEPTFTLGVILFCTSIVFIGTVGMLTEVWLAYGRLLPDTSIRKALVALWGFSSAVFELLVTFLLIRFLWASRTGIQGLDKVVIKLFTISIESSLPCLIFVLILGITVLLNAVSSNFFLYSTSSLYGLSVMMSLNCREKIQNHLSEYRREGALMNFAVEQTNAMTESQMFSQDGLATRRISQAQGNDVTAQYRRPSILSFVKEAIMAPPRPQT